MLDLVLLAKVCDKALIIFLYGNLGAGKTTFARGFLRGLGIKGQLKAQPIPSLSHINLKIQLFHFDFYRVHDVTRVRIHWYSRLFHRMRYV